MKPVIKNVLIIVNLLKHDAEKTVLEITEYLESLGIRTIVFGFKGKPSLPNIKDIDLAFSLGGDGTVLFSSRILSARKVPIFAVNIGNFGFITEISKQEWKDAFDRYAQGKLGISERLILKGRIIRNGTEIACFKGLNDAVISSAGIPKIVNLFVSLSDTPVGGYRADGVIVSTPTGSTAYSAAAGGPILHPEMEAMILNPICPLSLSSRPIVIPGDEVIEVRVQESQRAEVIFTMDGQDVFPLLPNDRILFEKAEEKALLIRSDKRTFYEVLRAKLNWSGGSNA